MKGNPLTFPLGDEGCWLACLSWCCVSVSRTFPLLSTDSSPAFPSAGLVSVSSRSQVEPQDFCSPPVPIQKTPGWSPTVTYTLWCHSEVLRSELDAKGRESTHHTENLNLVCLLPFQQSSLVSAGRGFCKKTCGHHGQLGGLLAHLCAVRVCARVSVQAHV